MSRDFDEQAHIKAITGPFYVAPDSHESVPVLSAEEEARLRHEHGPDGTCPDWIGGADVEPCPEWRLLVTLDAERKASAARIEQLEGALRDLTALIPADRWRLVRDESQAAIAAALASEETP